MISTIEAPEETLLKRLELLILRNAHSPHKRIIIALAGTPGSGKSTISSALTRRFNARNEGKLQIVPMVRTGLRFLILSETNIANMEIFTGWLSSHKSYTYNNAERGMPFSSPWSSFHI
jgi:2-phosphoglycerate kinase